MAALLTARETINLLQYIKESGLHEVPEELKDIVWDGKVTNRGNNHNRCAICGFDEVLDWHHLVVVDYKVPIMVDGSYYEYSLGAVRLCPNHHALVHRESRT